VLGNVARVCRRPLEGRLNWYGRERERKRERERRTEMAKRQTRHPVEDGGESGREN